MRRNTESYSRIERSLYPIHGDADDSARAQALRLGGNTQLLRTDDNNSFPGKGKIVKWDAPEL